MDENDRFDEFVSLRLRRNEFEQIQDVISKNKMKYENVSHFIRCGIIKLIKEEDG